MGRRDSAPAAGHTGPANDTGFVSPVRVTVSGPPATSAGIDVSLTVRRQWPQFHSILLFDRSAAVALTFYVVFRVTMAEGVGKKAPPRKRTLNIGWQLLQLGGRQL